MCDLPTVIALLGVVAGLIVAAQVALGAAIAANNGLFTAPASPGFYLASAAALALAVATLAPIEGLIDGYVGCMGASAFCASQLSNFKNAVRALMAALGSQGLAAAAAAGAAWVPWAGQVPAWVIIGALLVEAAVIPTLIVFFNDLINCVRTVALIRAVGGPLLAAALGTVSVTYVVTGITFVRLSMRDRGKPPIPQK